MRADVMVDRLTSARSRLNLPTPCPACSDPQRAFYCDPCITALAALLDLTPKVAKSMYGRKRVGIQQ